MTEKFSIQNQDIASLSDFIEYLDSTTVVSELSASKYDKRKMQELASWLQKLANNRNFLSDHLTSELSKHDKFQADNDFKPSTLLLHSSAAYTIRAVIWLPTGTLFPPHVFAYYEPHDHNFDFFTVGYMGPGYTTSLYEYNYDEVAGLEGEVVDIKFIEKHQFKPNNVMYYYASKDIHIQYPPDQLTVTVNLIIPKKVKNRQYEFSMQDMEADCSATIIRGQIDRLVQERLLFQSIACIGNEHSLEKLRHLATTHPNELTRAEAWTSLIDNGHWTDADKQFIEREQNPYVLNIIHQKI